MNKKFYNEASAAKLGWDPSWFGCLEFDDSLIKAIREFQKKVDLAPDGLCGPTTFRRIYTRREADIYHIKRNFENKISKQEKENYIYCNGKKIPIEWDNVKENLSLPDTHYSTYKKERQPNSFIIHWDATLSSKHCRDILLRRGLSVHFSIDNDGTIYQMVDTNDIAWHAGRHSNKYCIGVEISNAVYEKFQKYYTNKGLEPRPIVKNTRVHNWTPKPFLGAYPVQINALKTLIKSVCGHYNIPLEVPLDEKGKLINKKCFSNANEFNGILCHYHINKKKWDFAGLELDKIVKEIKEGR